MTVNEYVRDCETLFIHLGKKGHGIHRMDPWMDPSSSTQRGYPEILDNRKVKEGYPIVVISFSLENKLLHDNFNSW